MKKILFAIACTSTLSVTAAEFSHIEKHGPEALRLLMNGSLDAAMESECLTGPSGKIIDRKACSDEISKQLEAFSDIEAFSGHINKLETFQKKHGLI